MLIHSIQVGLDAAYSIQESPVQAGPIEYNDQRGEERAERPSQFVIPSCHHREREQILWGEDTPTDTRRANQRGRITGTTQGGLIHMGLINGKGNQ